MATLREKTITITTQGGQILAHFKGVYGAPTEWLMKRGWHTLEVYNLRDGSTVAAVQPLRLNRERAIEAFEDLEELQRKLDLTYRATQNPNTGANWSESYDSFMKRRTRDINLAWDWYQSLESELVAILTQAGISQRGWERYNRPPWEGGFKNFEALLDYEERRSTLLREFAHAA